MSCCPAAFKFPLPASSSSAPPALPASTCSLRYVPTAVLSRQTAGLRGKSLIINLPGQPKSIRETIDEVSWHDAAAGATVHSMAVQVHSLCWKALFQLPSASGATCCLSCLPLASCPPELACPHPPRPLQVFMSIPACIDLLEGPYIETHDEVVKAFRPPALQRKQKPVAAGAAGAAAAGQ